MEREMAVSSRRITRGWLAGSLFAIAASVGVLATVSSWAAVERKAATPPERTQSQNKPQTSPDRSLTGVSKIRIGEHQTFTRIVLEMTGPFEWSVEQPAGSQVRVLIPGADLDSGIRSLDTKRGLVRSVQPARRGGGVEVLILCEPAKVQLRTMRLADPDRFVLDISLPGSGESNPILAQGRASSPPENVGKSAPASPTRPVAPATQPVAEPATAGGYEAKQPRQRPDMPEGASAEKAEAPAAPAEPVSPRGESAKSMTIVLDPGHGGHDTGAIGPSGLMEKDVVLDLAFRLRRLLQERLGVRVLMTRTEDVFISLPERSAFANGARADFMISLHVNAASRRGAAGFETFFFAREPSDSDARASAQRENLVIEGNGAAGKDLESLLRTTLADMAVTRDMKESSRLAEGILASLEKMLQVANRGVKSGPFYILATAAMPAVLVESAFITNPKEERRLQREDHRQRIAHALFEGIAAYKIRYEQRLGLRNVPSGIGS
jgi:N-acetylmuramoyl-L-alanine amidase